MTMEISLKAGNKSRSKIATIGAAIAFALMLCTMAPRPVRADDRGGHGDHDDRGDHGDRGHHDDRGWRGGDRDVYAEPNYYYVPEPDYYDAPDPDYYYPPGPGYYPPPPSEGINLFFGR
jgi:hypothetical protein